MPGTLNLRLSGAGAEVHPKWLHAAGCALAEDPAADHHAAVKPFSVGPVVDGPDGAASWRIGWLHDKPIRPPGGTIRFGPVAWPILDVRTRTLSYQELAASPPARLAELDLVSPTYFSRNGRDLPLPDPVLVVGSLVRRWNSHSPIPIDDDLRARLLGAVYLDACEGRTVRVAVTFAQQQTGFVGTVRLGLLRRVEVEVSGVFAALMRYAGFAGVGAQTTHGFGAANLTDLVAAPAGVAVPTGTGPARERSRDPGPRAPETAGEPL